MPGYRLETPDRVIVIAGDTTPKGEVVENCHECDVLIYEAYTLASFEKVSTEWKQYRVMFPYLDKAACGDREYGRSPISWYCTIAAMQAVTRRAHKTAAMPVAQDKCCKRSASPTGARSLPVTTSMFSKKFLSRRRANSA